jgi:hypothetical protein
MIREYLMRKRQTQPARAFVETAGNRRAQASFVALCALGAGILAAMTYGLIHRSTPDASAAATAVGDKNVAGAATAAPVGKAEAATEDRLLTGSLPATAEVPPLGNKAKPQAAKKKKPAKIEAQKTFFDYFNYTPPTSPQQKR